MVGEDTFYERAADRDARFAALVHEVTAANPTFLAGADVAAAGRPAQYLRQTMRMRSAAIVMAAEYVAAGGDGGRSVIARTLQRADEPAELLGYWLTRHGRKVPMPIKRGIADAVRRLYTERAALKYDGLVASDAHGRRGRARAPVAARRRASRRCSSSSSIAVTTTTHAPTRRCCRCSPRPPISRRSRSTSVERCCALAALPRSPTRASRGSACRAGCRAAWTPRRGRRSSRRWV